MRTKILFLILTLMTVSCSDNEFGPQPPVIDEPSVQDINLLLYPTIGDVSTSDIYSVSVNGQQAVVECKNNYDVPVHFVQWAADDNVINEIVIAVPQVIRDYDITPLPKGASAKVRGQNLTVSFSGSHYMVIRINDLPELFILVDNKKDYWAGLQSKRVYNASDYITSHSSVRTAELQRALDDAAAFGAVLWFPKGIYRTGTVNVPSNTTIIIDPGAIILGSTKESDYIREKEFGTNAAAVGSLFRIKDAQNIRILGNGTIDGSAWSGLRRVPGSDTNLATEIYLIYATDSKNIEIDGVTLRDPTFWNTRIFRCTDVRLSNVKVINCRPQSTYNTTDGVDFDSSQHCSFTHGFIYGGDDNCVVKGRDRKKEFDTFDITFRDVVCYSNTCGCKIGTESFNNQIYDVTFEDIDIVSSQRTMAIDVKDGSQIHDVAFRNIRVHGFHKLNGSYRMLDLSLNDRDKVKCLSTIKNIEFANIDYLCPAESAKVRIKGLSEESYIDGVTFSAIKVNGKMVSSLDDMVTAESNIETNEWAKNVIFR